MAAVRQECLQQLACARQLLNDALQLEPDRNSDKARSPDQPAESSDSGALTAQRDRLEPASTLPDAASASAGSDAGSATHLPAATAAGAAEQPWPVPAAVALIMQARLHMDEADRLAMAVDQQQASVLLQDQTGYGSQPQAEPSRHLAEHVTAAVSPWGAGSASPATWMHSSEWNAEQEVQEGVLGLRLLLLRSCLAASVAIRDGQQCAAHMRKWELAAEQAETEAGEGAGAGPGEGTARAGQGAGAGSGGASGGARGDGSLSLAARRQAASTARLARKLVRCEDALPLPLLLCFRCILSLSVQLSLPAVLSAQPPTDLLHPCKAAPHVAALLPLLALSSLHF